MAGEQILVIEDDLHVQEILRLYLEKDGYRVAAATEGPEGLSKAWELNPDLIILDLMLPGLGGWDLCRALRQESRVPVIMLTAKGEDYDKILGLELGADDYITKPFNPAEVVARVKAILRRTAPAEAPEDARVLRFPMLTIDLDRFTVEVAGRPVPLTPKETELLWFLAKRPGTVFKREQLLNQVWGYDYTGDARTVDVHIKRIRQKLHPEGSAENSYPWGLRTVWGVGYKFEVDKDKVSPKASE
ncbi:MAG: response regulator transcription factor [Syntrophothermus sp.]